MDKTNKKARFIKIYANLPINIRNDIIYVLPNENRPISWNAAFLEVENNTETGKLILENLDELNII